MIEHNICVSTSIMCPFYFVPAYVVMHGLIQLTVASLVSDARPNNNLPSQHNTVTPTASTNNNDYEWDYEQGSKCVIQRDLSKI